MATSQAAADMARDAILTPRVSLALVRAAASLSGSTVEPEATIDVRVKHGRSMVLVGRVLSEPEVQGKRAQWVIAATRADLADLWASKGAAGITDAQLDEAAVRAWDALTVA